MIVHCNSNLIKIIHFQLKYLISLSLSLSLSLFSLFLLSPDSLFFLFFLNFFSLSPISLFSILFLSFSLVLSISSSLQPFCLCLLLLIPLSLSHWFPIGVSHSALVVTVGHLVMVGLGCGSQFGGGLDLVVSEIW